MRFGEGGRGANGLSVAHGKEYFGYIDVRQGRCYLVVAHMTKKKKKVARGFFLGR